MTILGGIFYFREGASYSPTQWVGFVSGILVTVVGAFVLYKSQQANADRAAREEAAVIQGEAAVVLHAREASRDFSGMVAGGGGGDGGRAEEEEQEEAIPVAVTVAGGGAGAPLLAVGAARSSSSSYGAIAGTSTPPGRAALI